MSFRRAVLAALRGDAELLPIITDTLRQRIEGKDETAITTVVQAAEALEPILAEAVQRKPSRLGKFG